MLRVLTLHSTHKQAYCWLDLVQCASRMQMLSHLQYTQCWDYTINRYAEEPVELTLNKVPVSINMTSIQRCLNNNNERQTSTSCDSQSKECS